MKKRLNIRRIDLLYVVIWLVVGLLCVMDMALGHAGPEAHKLPMAVAPGRVVLTLVPFVLLFVYNNYFLIPRYLLPGRLRPYLWGVCIGFMVIFALQYGTFMWHEMTRPPMPDMPHMILPRRLFPLPLLLNIIYDALVIGGGTAITLTFQRFDDRLDRERLQKATAENELSYLRAQINPHFYMNMLNNIHGMIEIDPTGAQEMVMEMSDLMRYMLYDSSRPETTLDKEVEFIRTYLKIMRRRYPESRVEIRASLPEGTRLVSYSIPPLLFLVFIENAFKHGISYRKKSFVDLSMDISDGRLTFRIANSRSEEAGSTKPCPGIGIRNIRQRLGLIFGQKASLEIADEAETFTVRLSIPLYETEDTGN